MPAVLNDTEGCFAAYSVDAENPQYGWKHYPIKACIKEEGSRLHAYTEKTILDFLQDKTEFENNISKLHDFKHDEKTFQLKIRNVQPGRSLLDLLNEPSLVTPEVAVNITCKLVECLSLLHTKYDITHGDLKPDNILIDSDYNPILIDWGSGCWGKNNDKRQIITGNIQFSSPQLVKKLKGRRNLTFNARKNDVFQLGMIICLIWTCVQSKGKATQTALGQEWDQFCDNEEFEEEALIQFQNALVDAYTEVSHCPGFFKALPMPIQNIIQAALTKAESKRPNMIDIHTNLFESSIKRGGVTYKLKNFMQNPSELEFVQTIEGKFTIPNSIDELYKFWTFEQLPTPLKILNKEVCKAQKILRRNDSIKSSTSSSGVRKLSKAGIKKVLKRANSGSVRSQCSKDSRSASK